MNNAYQLVVNFNEGVKDYASATLYINDNLYKKLEDIFKPEDRHAQWYNKLVFKYSKIAQDILPQGARITTYNEYK